MFKKALKIEKGRHWSIPDKKMVDKDAICPINLEVILSWSNVKLIIIGTKSSEKYGFFI